MNQCVPSWDLDDPVGGGGIGGGGGGGHRVVSGGGGAFMPVAVPTSDQYYEVAELTVGVVAAADALVPCDADAAEGRSKRPRVVVGEDGRRACASQGSAAPGRRGESTLLTLDACCGTAADDVCGFTTTTNNSTSLEDRTEDKGSPETENTSIAGGASDSRCFSRRSQSQASTDSS
uniref:Uncharacterized protein n=1 Tax=Oryza barthii TaxID=65489 RepID=A0A0D3HGI1_9ORYZ